MGENFPRAGKRWSDWLSQTRRIPFTPQYLSNDPNAAGRATPPHRQNHLDVALFTPDTWSETGDYTDVGCLCQAKNPLQDSKIGQDYMIDLVHLENHEIL